jgi:hypothetical protein
MGSNGQFPDAAKAKLAAALSHAIRVAAGVNGNSDWIRPVVATSERIAGRGDGAEKQPAFQRFGVAKR